MTARKLLMALIAPGIIALLLQSTSVAQQSVQYYEQGGVVYRESRSVVQRPHYETQIQPRERTIYREQVSTEYQPQTRTVFTPVTTYRWKAKWHDVLNPFKPAYMGYHMVPTTEWQAHTQQVETPVVRRTMVPHKEIVNVPVTTQRIVNDEVIRRTVVNTRPGVTTGTTVARRPVGGVSELENDPPRQGAEWRAAGDALRR